MPPDDEELWYGPDDEIDADLLAFCERTWELATKAGAQQHQAQDLATMPCPRTVH